MVKIYIKQVHIYNSFKTVQDLPKRQKTWNHSSIGYTNSNEVYFMSIRRLLDLISLIFRSISTYYNFKFKRIRKQSMINIYIALTWKLISQGYTNPNETYHICFPGFLEWRSSNLNPEFTNSIHKIHSTTTTELQDLC